MAIDGEIAYERVLALVREMFEAPLGREDTKTLSAGNTWLRLRFRGDGVQVTGIRSLRDLDGPMPVQRYRLSITYPARLRTEVLARFITADFHPQRFHDCAREDLARA